MSKILTVGSLFSGIGGIELGLERTNHFRTIWQSEIDPWASAVLKKHWPGVENLGDITKIDWKNVQRPDLICGGFPCQDISQAGRQAGIRAGKRSGLWSEFAKAIRVLRPRYVLVENVPTLAYLGLDVVLADLASCGYDAEWSIISAADVGAPHLRERIFIVAYSTGNRQSWPGAAWTRRHGFEDCGQPLSHPEDDRLGRRLEQPQESQEGGHVANPEGQRRHDGDDGKLLGPRAGEVDPSSGAGRDSRELEAGWWAVEPDVGRVAHGVSNRVDRLKCLGNAVVPQVAQVIGERIIR